MKELKQQTETNGGTMLKVLPVQGCSLQEEEEELHVNRRETAWLTGAFSQLFILVKDGY